MANLSDLFPRYHPAMMQFDGSTGYLQKTYTSSGQVVSAVFRFIREPFTGGGQEVLFAAASSGEADKYRIYVAVDANDHATPARQGRLLFNVRASDGTPILQLHSTLNVCDSVVHGANLRFNATTGAFYFYVDGGDADNGSAPNRVVSTGTLSTGASTDLTMGAQPFFFGRKFGGQIGFFGMRDADVSNYSSFFDSKNRPKAVDESTWSQWGAQPEFWNEHCDLAYNNLGSAGDMTKTGSVYVGKGGN